MPEKLLFGGSITCNIPADWKDVSTIRQVPDHQECWMDNNDRLFVVEILSRQNVNDEDAAAFFYKDLAAANGITDDQHASFTKASPNLAMEGLPSSASLCFGTGIQRVAMGKDVDIFGNPRQQEIKWIRVELCSIRLPSVDSDILLTLNTPLEVNPQDTATDSQFLEIVSSFRVRNWNLFG